MRAIGPRGPRRSGIRTNFRRRVRDHDGLPLLAGDERLLDIVSTPTSGEGGFVVAAGIGDSADHCTVWLRTDSTPWRRIIAHPEPAVIIALCLAGSSPRDLYCGIGDSVYRPARIGAALFNREIIAPEAGLAIAQLRALRLVDGVPMAAFAERTGLPPERIAAALAAARQRGWLHDDPQRLHTTALGQRFLNDVIGVFLD